MNELILSILKYSNFNFFFLSFKHNDFFQFSLIAAHMVRMTTHPVTIVTLLTTITSPSTMIILSLLSRSLQCRADFHSNATFFVYVPILSQSCHSRLKIASLFPCHNLFILFSSMNFLIQLLSKRFNS